MKAQGENKSSQWLEFLNEIFGSDNSGDFYINLLQDVYLREFFLSLPNPNKDKENLKNRINKYKDLSFTLSETETLESDQLTTEALVNNKLIKAFIKVHNVKAELDKKALGENYTPGTESRSDRYTIELTKDKHTISTLDKKTGKLYTAVFTKNIINNTYEMDIVITGVDDKETETDKEKAFKKMQQLVEAENHIVTLKVGYESIDLFNDDINKTIASINQRLEQDPLLTTTTATPPPAAAAASDTASGTAVDTAAASDTASGTTESKSHWVTKTVAGGVTGGFTGGVAGGIVAAIIAVIAVATTAPVSVPALAIAGAVAGGGAGLAAGGLVGYKAEESTTTCKVVENATLAGAVTGAVAGLATGAGAIAGAVAAHGALGTGAFATGATSHAACVSTGASAAVRIIGNTAIAYSKGEASLSKFGIDATLATVGIGGGEALFNFSHRLTESADLAIGRNITAIAAEFCKYKCQEEQEKKPLASLASAAFSGLSAAYSVGAAEFGAADSLRHVGESPSQQHHNLLEDMQRVFGRGDYDQIKEYQEHVFKIFSLGECETGSVLNLAENQNKIDNFLHENPEAIKNLYHYLMPTETKNNVYGELEFISHHAEDIVALDNFFASDTTNTDGEKLSLLEQLKVVNALKQVDPDFTLETTTTFDDYFKEHKSIITQAMGYNCSNPHPITSQDFCNLLLKTGGEEEFQKSLNHLAKLQSETKQMFDLKTSDTSHSHHHHSIEKLTENQASLIEQLKTHEEILKNMAHDLDVLNKTDYSSSLHQTNSPTKKVEILMDMMYDAHTKLDGFFTKDDLSGHSIADKLRFVAILSENSQDITSDTDFATYYKNNTDLIEKTIHLFNPQAEINKTNFINTVLKHASGIDKEYGKLNTDTNVPFAKKVDFLSKYIDTQKNILDHLPLNDKPVCNLNSISTDNQKIYDFIQQHQNKLEELGLKLPPSEINSYSQDSLNKIKTLFNKINEVYKDDKLKLDLGPKLANHDTNNIGDKITELSKKITYLENTTDAKSRFELAELHKALGNNDQSKINKTEAKRLAAEEAKEAKKAAEELDDLKKQNTMRQKEVSTLKSEQFINKYLPHNHQNYSYHEIPSNNNNNHYRLYVVKRNDNDNVIALLIQDDKDHLVYYYYSTKQTKIYHDTLCKGSKQLIDKDSLHPSKSNGINDDKRPAAEATFAQFLKKYWSIFSNINTGVRDEWHKDKSNPEVFGPISETIFKKKDFNLITPKPNCKPQSATNFIVQLPVTNR